MAQIAWEDLSFFSNSVKIDVVKASTAVFDPDFVTTNNWEGCDPNNILNSIGA